MKLLPQAEQVSDRRRPAERTPQSQRFSRLPKLPKKLLIYGVIALVVMLLVMIMFRPTPISVDVAQAKQAPLQVTIEAEGKTRVKDRYEIVAAVNGQLERISLDEGDPVQTGMVVAQIDPLPQTAAVEQALAQLAEWRAQRAGVATQRPKTEALAQARHRIEAARANQQQAAAKVDQARASLAQAQRDRQRAEQLESSGAISRQQREQAELEERNRAEELAALTRVAQAAEAEVAVAQEALALLQAEQSDPDYLLRVYDARIASTEAELAQLQDQAQRTQMRSPVNGQVLKVMQRSAQFVSAGTPLLEIGDPSQLELVIDVLSSDAEKIQIGDAIRIASGQGDSLQGRVKRIEPSAFTKVSALGVEEQRVNVIGEFVSPPRYLGDGYRVETGIVIWQNPQVLQVPLSSLFRCHTSSWCTFVVEHGKAVQRQVQIDHRSQFAVEVQQGLKAGETVILHPTEQIHEGSRVTARNSAS